MIFYDFRMDRMSGCAMSVVVAAVDSLATCVVPVFGDIVAGRAGSLKRHDALTLEKTFSEGEAEASLDRFAS